MSNPVLPYRRKRLQQKGLAQIDWSNQITRGLLSACDFVNFRDIKTGKPFVINGTIEKRAGQQGIGAQFTPHAGIDLQAGGGLSSIIPVTNAFTILISIRINSLGTRRIFLGDSNSSGALDSIYVEQTAANQWHVSATDSSKIAHHVSGGTVTLGKHTVAVVWNKSNIRLYADGVLIGSSAFAGSRAAGVSYQLGRTGSYSAGLGFDGEMYSHLILARDCNQSEVKSLSANPWQIFAPIRRHLFVPAASGLLNAAADGAAQAGGSANIAAQVALAAVGLSSASGSAGLSTAIPLSAAGFAVSGGTANAVATVRISAAGLAQASGSAGLSAAVLLQGAGAAQAAGNAALAAQLNALASGAAQASGTANLSGGAPGELSASDGAVASGTAVLSVTVGLTASGSGVASGIASLSGGAAGQVAAVGGAQSGGSAVLRATVSLTAAGFVQAMGAGYLTLSLPFSGFAPLKMAAAHQRLNHLSISARRLSQLRSEVSHG